MSRRNKHPIPSPGVVRVVATVLLLIDLVLIAVLVLNYQTLQWTGWLLLIGAATSMYFPIMALKTGDPEWVLLDLIIPG